MVPGERGSTAKCPADENQCRENTYRTGKELQLHIQKDRLLYHGVKGWHWKKQDHLHCVGLQQTICENQSPRGSRSRTVLFFSTGIHNAYTGQGPIREIKDPPYNFEHYAIRISQLRMSLLDYNVQSKQLKVCILLPDQDEMMQCEDLDANLTFVVMNVIGEIAFKRHIKYIEFIPLEGAENGLLDLIDLPDYIDYLYQINSRRKTRTI